MGFVKNMKQIITLFPKNVWFLTGITFLFISRKTIFNVQREVGDYSVSADGGTFVALIAMGVSFIVICRQFHVATKAISSSKSFVGYYLFAMCSFLWAGSFSTMMMKGIEVLLSFAIVALSLYKLRNLKLAFLYVIVLSTLNAVVPYLIRAVSWATPMVHTNTFTIGAIIGLMLSVGAIKSGLFSYSFLKYIIWANAIVLVCGTSTASYISAILGFIILYSSNKKGLNFVKTILVCLVVVGCYYFFKDALFNLIFQGRSEEVIESGTGRDVIWEACINAYKESPWLGHGFVVGERNLAGYGLGFNQLSAHNSFFSVLVNTGIIGVIVWFNFVFRWLGRTFLNSSHNVYAAICFPVSIAIFVNSLSFPFIGSDWNVIAPAGYALIIFVLMYIKKGKVIK